MGKRKAAFTLIEIMLSLLVVTIGIVAMVGLLGTSLDNSARAQSDLHSVSFADMIFNYCHTVTNWNAIPTGGRLSIPDYNGDLTSIPIRQLAQFDCVVPGFDRDLRTTYSVTYLLDVEAFGNNVKELSLKVWPGFSTNGTPRIFYTELYNWTK